MKIKHLLNTSLSLLRDASRFGIIFSLICLSLWFSFASLPARAEIKQPVVTGVQGRSSSDKPYTVGKAFPGGDLKITGSNFTAPANTNTLWFGIADPLPASSGNTRELIFKLPISLSLGRGDAAIKSEDSFDYLFSENFILEVVAAETTNSGGSGNRNTPECQRAGDPPPDIPSQTTSGDAVKCAQQKINEKCNTKIPNVNGTYTAQMKSVVEECQGELDLYCWDGVVGPETWNALLDTTKYSPKPTCSNPNPDKNPSKPVDKKVNTATAALDCGKLGLTEKDGLCFPDEVIQGSEDSLVGSKNIGTLIRNIVRILLILVGSLAVLFLVVGAVMYMTSAGNSAQTEKGKKTMMMAVFGLVVAALAYTLVTIAYNLLTTGAVF